MKNRIIIAAILCGFALNTNNASAQDPRFTQFFAVPLLINPAIMGANNSLWAGLDYRSQWGAVSSGYTNYALNAMYPLQLKGNGGKLDVGLSVLGGKAGAFSTMNALLAVDYNKEVAEDNHLCLALIGGFGQESISTSGLTFDDQYVNGAYSASTPSNENVLNQKQGYADVGFGFTWYYNPSRSWSKINAYVGISGYHLNQPNLSLTGSSAPLPARMCYMAGLKLFEAKNVDITPNAYLMVQGGNIESAVGVYGDYFVNDNMKLTLGFWYRRNDALAILIGFEYQGFTLGYSYDAVTSSLNMVAASVNANEITLSYNMGAKGGSTPSFGGTDNKSSTTTTPNPSPFPQF